jgi:hypothetical protein
MAQTPEHQPPAPGAPDPLASARFALERGDYGQVLAQLKPLASTYPPATATGAQLQLLMATALMGQGNSVAALACCRQARRCSDPTLRAQASDLLTVLEAQALERPRRWSLTLPELGEAEPLAGRLQQIARSRRTRQTPPPPAPPVGPTRAPVGFAALVLTLLLLGLLLGGCVQIRAELQFGGPGRLQLVEEISPPAGQPPLGWQRQFSAALQQLGMRPQALAGVGAVGGSAARLAGPMQPASATLALLETSVLEAGRLAGLALPPPSLHWRERNWLIGVRQELAIELDLRGSDGVPGVVASLDLQPLRLRAIRQATPQPVQLQSPGDSGRLRWPLQLGALNQLQLRCWRWSPLGLGAVAVGLLLGLVLGLAALRQRLGFGWPQLPA